VSPVRQQRISPLLNIVFPILVAFLFAVFTGTPELVGFLRATHPVVVIGGLGLIAVFVTGRFMQVILSPVGKLLTLFTVWFILCIPMAIWRGGSFGTFVDIWSKSFLAYILTAGLISTAAQSKKAFHTIAYSVGFLGSLALVLHQYDRTGRLGLAGGRYENANEFGFALLVGLPFLAFMFLQGRGVRKAAAVVLAGSVLIALAKTGSRGCLLGAGVLVLYAFFRASKAVRAKLVMAVPILFVLLVLVVPSGLRDRYVTLFSSRNDHTNQTSTNNTMEAAGSAEARLVTLKDSIWLTILHPFSGVGPGNFPVAQNSLAISRGELKGQWHVTHNTYTELSSEMGIPGLVIYLAFLYQCWKTLTAMIRRKTTSGELRVMAETVRAALVTLMTVAAFDSLSYNTNIPILAGLVTALGFIAQTQRSRPKVISSDEPALSTLPEPAFEPAWSGRP
jgi:O-antigen ligase